MTPAPQTDPAPQIETFVVLMRENHSFGNYFGMLGDPGHLSRPSGIWRHSPVATPPPSPSGISLT